MEDELLIRQFQEGNHAAFDELLERYKNRVYAFSFKLLQNCHDAEDLSQETFIHAYNNMNKFRGEGSFISWLFAITVNGYRSFKRKRRLNVVNVEMEEIVQPQKEEAIEEVSNQEWQCLAKSAIDNLPQKQKIVLILRTFEQRSYEEIAQILGISKDSVKANLSYARQNLRNHLQDLAL